VFLSAYLASGGERIASAMRAYSFKNLEAARVSSYRFLANPKVKAAIKVFYGEADDQNREEFLTWLEKAIKRGKLSIADRDSIKLLFAARGWKMTPEVARELETHGAEKRRELAAAEARARTEAQRNRFRDM